MKNVLGGEKSKVALLYISTLLGVFFGLFSSIINTHFLDVSAYGDVRYVQNIIYFIASLLLFGYFHSGSRLLALSKSEAYSRRLRGGLIVILGIATLILMLSCFFCAFFPHHNKDIISQLFFISIPVCAAPLLSNYINTTSQGDQHIGRLAIARFFAGCVVCSDCICYL